MAEAAIIFDVDGVLLELTRAEEEVFFEALSEFVQTDDLSRDWNSYRVRNDDDIIAEILDRNGLPMSLRNTVKQHYIALLQRHLAGQSEQALATQLIQGATALLQHFSTRAILGIATANLIDAAQLRLQAGGLWPFVESCAQGADGGGHKHVILERLLGRIDMPRGRVVYIGDNINDVEAGCRAGVHFIGFSTDPARLAKLAQGGARWTSHNHDTTRALIEQLLFSPPKA